MSRPPAGGACADPAVAALFDDPTRPEPALAACAGCSVLAACQTWAVGVDLGDAVAGGMTATQRAAAAVAGGSVVEAFEWRTLRQQVADADTPAAGRRILAEETLRLTDDDGLPAGRIADLLGTSADEVRRLRDAGRQAQRRAGRKAAA